MTEGPGASAPGPSARPGRALRGPRCERISHRNCYRGQETTGSHGARHRAGTSGQTMRSKLSAIGLAAALALGALVGLAPGTAAAAATTSGQVVTVFAANSTTTWATVE